MLAASEGILTTNPCQTCGACCANFRVSFYWGEADDAPGGIVPAQLTEKISPQLRCMKGTASKPVRCVALEGEVGKRVSCSILSAASVPLPRIRRAGSGRFTQSALCGVARATAAILITVPFALSPRRVQ